MKQKRCLVLYFLIFALISAAANAAFIHGSLYDIGLDEITDVVVSIDTAPKQQKVAKNGTYSFNVPSGSYTITAKEYSGSEVASSAEENITVAGAGDYVLDLILFPSFDEEEQLLAEAEFEIEMELLEDEPNYVGIAILFIAIIAFFFILRMREKDIRKGREEIDKEEADEIKKVIDFLKKEGGRTTQKDIRKNFPQSEAKISLIISELEDAGRIRKIKKGRGNIIILNK